MLPSPLEVHVWRSSLELAKQRIEALSETLSPEERNRASRYHFGVDRDRFIVARGLLRTLLATYLGVQPSAVEFSYNEFGKPCLAAKGNRELCFNLSHSGDLAVFAFARAEVGIDIERIRPDFAREEIAERFFSPEEVKALRDLPAELQPLGFFNCWTRKEAYIKGCGQGLTMPLSAFAVSLRPGEPAALVWHAEAPEVCEWSLRELVVPEPYVAAIAVRLKHWILCYRTLPVGEFSRAEC
jgi:4'-phosphopantetheinyl transferase